MSAHCQCDEVTLRRNLLFRLLQNFDFEKPVFHYEAISEPIMEMSLIDDVDSFVFKRDLKSRKSIAKIDDPLWL